MSHGRRGPRGRRSDGALATLVRRRMRAVALSLALMTLGLARTDVARAAPPPEPPADADAGADYVAEPDDSLDTGSLRASYGLAGRGGRTWARSRSLRFRSDSVDAGLRDGDGDPYEGGDVGARGGGRWLKIGRIAPAWGRGIVVGAVRDPWTAAFTGDADPFSPRARGGDGVWCAWPRHGVEVFGGQFAGRAAGGWAGTRDGVRLGVAAARGTPACATVSVERADYAAEWALEAAGRWRAEATAARHAGPLEVALRASTGNERFRAPLAPARATPARVAAMALRGGSGPASLEATLAGWRYVAGAAGARAGLEATWSDGASRVLSAGFEEQRGARRAPLEKAPVATGMRQGAWVEWRGQAAGYALSVRDEWWGRMAFARGRVRRALGAGVEATLPAGARLAVAHTVYRARSGETVYLPERDSDRWVLRALSGAGDRTRVTLWLPLAEGTLRGAVAVGRARGARHTQWSFQWSRRIRVRRTP